MSEKHSNPPDNATMGVGIALGMGVGVALGTSLGNLALGIPIGISLGVAYVLVMQDVKRRKNNPEDPS